jgi:hypothetical protein
VTPLPAGRAAPPPPAAPTVSPLALGSSSDGAGYSATPTVHAAPAPAAFSAAGVAAAPPSPKAGGGGAGAAGSGGVGGAFEGGGGSAAADGGGHLAYIPFVKLSKVKRLGSGAFGDVWHYTWAGTDAAVKLSGVSAGDREALAREIALYEVLLKNPHPGVVQVLGVCVDAPDGQVRLVMRLCAKGSLESMLKQRAIKVRHAP